MRAPFNETLDAYQWPTGGVFGPPLLTDVPCRLVEQEQITTIDGPLVPVEHWVTCSVYFGGPASSFDWGGGTIFADLTPTPVFAIPAGGPPEYVTICCQEVVPSFGPPYYRYLVCPYIP